MKPFLHASTKAKISLTDENSPEELWEMFHPSQLEEKFGGHAENAT